MVPQIAVKVEEMSSYTNRLSKEKSPYLLQHAHNPVDWYPWGQEAFAKAKAEDKPVILSIGYSTCHWCHVMEEESFSDPKVADVMNEHFVSIKVDREERPDIDSVYMSYVTASTGSGGWPMNVFLMPDKKPFYGGTYFPPEDRYGIPAFKHLLISIAESWRTRRQDIADSAQSAVDFLNKNVGAGLVPAQGRPQGSPLQEEILTEAYGRFDANFDEGLAGFGGAPKFPRSHTLSFILRHWRRSKDPRALEIVEKTLKAMAEGGMYDQLGGGFHRYSTDAHWRVPHFEKMLYDQAILARTYLEAFQATHNPFYERIAREILDYVASRMTGPEGAFFSAEDADSADPEDPSIKKEGAYFVWRKTEIEKILGPDAESFSSYYGVQPSGNALSDPHQEFTGKNVLYVAQGDNAPATLKESRKKMLAAREKRPAPYLDDKILTDWNGLMISAFAFAASVLDDAGYAEKAAKAAEFFRSRMTDKKGNLLHRYRGKEAGIEGHLNDYSFMIFGYLAVYEAVFDPKWLEEAKNLADKMVECFWDEEAGGFFLTARDAEELISRPKEVYDGAVPSGNSLAALGLILLDRFTGTQKYGALARKTLAAFSGALVAEPANTPQMLIALDFILGPSMEMVLAGEKKAPMARAMLREIYSRFIPNKIVLFHTDGGEYPALDGKTTIYVCRNHACQLPVTDLEGLKKILNTGDVK